MKYLPVSEARHLPGLRLVLGRGLPGPYSEAAKALMKIKKIEYIAVAQYPMERNEDLRDWTGVRNAPVAVLDDEPAYTTWLDLIRLAERLGSGPSLLPDLPLDQALALGLCCELCGPEGFGWVMRLVMLSPETSGMAPGEGLSDYIKRDYGVSEETISRAPARAISILNALGDQIRRQEANGQSYLVGDGLTVADIYWACFSQAVSALPPEQCPMPEWMRTMYAAVPREIVNAVDPLLIRHRDRVFKDHIGLPLRF